MNRRIKISISSFLFLFFGISSFAQNGTEKIPIISVLANPQKDSIMLRWGPQDVSTWQHLNNTGYSIMRYTITVDEKIVSRPVGLLLTKTPLKPLPLSGWKTWVDQEDKYASVAAQALYGEQFLTTQTVKSGPGQLINQVKENELRFSFALFSADQSFMVAKAMALGYVDKTTKPNEKYLYRIYPAVADKQFKIDTGSVFTGFVDAKPLAKPFDLQVEAQDRNVLLSWNQYALLGIYTTYLAERSEDFGKTYVQINDAPIVNTSEKEDASNRATKLDTVSAIDHKLIYRIRGITPFGETGPYSDTVSVIAIKKFTQMASLIKPTVDIKGNVILNWEMPNEILEAESFDVERSLNPDKDFEKINKKLLLQSVRTFIDPEPNNANYYRIKSYGKGEQSTFSFPVFVQLEDSIPPEAPQQPKGTIDKAGLVKITWEANTEADIFGYRVYRANSKDGEYSQITREAALKTAFVDTIEVATLTKNIFYKLVALDKHFNPSKFSEALLLKRPDIIPPTPPSFNDVKASSEGIFLAWNRSVSDDVARHEIFRQANESNWKLLKSFTDTTGSFTDTTADFKTFYTYKVIAVDSSKLNTESKPYTIKRLDLGIRPGVITAKITPNRTDQQILIQWNYNQPKVVNYLLYRAESGKPLKLYKTLDGKLKSFTDTDLLINNLYQYRLKALFSDGTDSGFSKAFEVTY